ncbi:MAG: hypothetical protein J7J72_03150 [Bacteroidales bacterium]|nr:hypothetical protein [Bacteroidales bacterium]
MKNQDLLDEILLIIRSTVDDRKKLEKIHEFLLNEVSEDVEENEIPEKYKKYVSEIAKSINAGLVCYLNLDTLEIEDIPQHLDIDDPEEYELMTGKPFESLDIKHLEWENYISFEPLHSSESFKIMEDFTNILDDKILQGKLINTLNRRKPFANFKDLIDNSQYREDWFNFKQKQTESHVAELLLSQLDEIQEDSLEEINGIYNDDGTKVDPQTIPLPALCIICKKYQIDDWDENLLCQMNRHDQRNDDEFKCGAFENI